MKSSDDIFLLVKSLSKQEKSYFKKFATAFTEAEGNNYLMLFDALVKQASKRDEYDEEEIKKLGFTGKFLKNFPFHKNYFYNMLLSALTVYHKEGKDNIPLRNMLTQSEILFSKSLYEQSMKVLMRAKKYAEDTDKFSYLFEILNFERIINKYISTDSELILERSMNLLEDQTKALEMMKTDVEYYKLTQRLSYVRRFGTGFLRTEEEIRNIEKNFENPLLKDEANAKTFFSKTLFNTMWYQYYTLRNDHDKAYEKLKENADMWEKKIIKGSGRFENYTFALNNLIGVATRTGRLDISEVYLKKMKELPQKHPKLISERDRVFIFYSYTIQSIVVNFELLRKEKLIEIASEAKLLFPEFEKKINLQQRIILYYFLGTTNFVLADHEQCMHWMGKIINVEKTDFSQDYQCYSRIVYLIAVYELGYIDHLEYALKSAYHFISKRNRVYQYENIILKYLRRSFRIKSEKEAFEMFEEMKFELEKIKDDPYEQNAFDAFNIMYWLDSKIRKIPLLSAMKVNVGQTSNVKRQM